jgi:metallo-beta-lactamase class B
MKLLLVAVIFPIFQIQAQNSLRIERLRDDFYIFTTYQNYKGKPFPANGMYVVTNAGVIMIDTPWDTTQLQPLLDSINAKHKTRVVMAISTHSHADRTAGLTNLKASGVRTFTSALTDKLCVEHKENRAEYTFQNDTTFRVGQFSFEAYYPGEGHTMDNIVIWFPSQRVLYGGCLIKSTESTTLGNISEANLEQWPVTIQNIRKKIGTPLFIIPGHEGWADISSLEHTLMLIRTKP